jgi:hypothetical protein
LAFLVTKADGSKQQFDKEKVIRTCLRVGASTQTAQAVANKVESRLYDNIPTSRILQLIFLYLREDKPALHQFFDLRKGISLMSPKPEFETFIQLLLANNGFEVRPNQLLVGRCVEHEVDAIAMKNGIAYFVEAKHHSGYHSLTGLDESRIARAVLEDVTEAFSVGKTNMKIDGAVIVTNTKYSEQATRYANCRGIVLIGWNTPPNLSVQNMVEEKHLYPLSCIKTLGWNERMRLVESGILLMKQVAEESPISIAKRTGLQLHRLERIREKVDHYF